MPHKWLNIKSLQNFDYATFGSMIENRSWTAGSGYRFGFNGMEKDDEVKGGGNSLDFGARVHDSRIGRFLSVDPKQHLLPSQSTYCFAGNQVIWAIDDNGEIKVIVIVQGTNPDGTKYKHPERVIYNEKTAAELDGVRYEDVYIYVNVANVEYHPVQGSSYSYTKEVLKTISITGGHTNREQVYEEGRINGWAWDLSTRSPWGKITSALLRKDLNNGDHLNGFETASKVFEGLIDILTLCRGNALVEGAKEYAKNKGIEYAEDRIFELTGLDENEYAKLVYGLAKLGRNRVINQDEYTDLAHQLSEVVSGTKTLSDFYGGIQNQYGVDIEVDYLNKEEALMDIENQLRAEYSAPKSSNEPNVTNENSDKN